MKKLLPILLAMLTHFPLSGQATTGAHRVNQVIARGNSGVTAQIVPYALVAVSVTSSGVPATIYSDPLLTAQIIGSTVTADASGNYGYYYALGVCLTETISSPSQGSITIQNVCSTSGSSGTISGSGTVGYLPIFSGSTAIGNSNIYQSGPFIYTSLGTVISDGVGNMTVREGLNSNTNVEDSDGNGSAYFQSGEFGVFTGGAPPFCGVSIAICVAVGGAFPFTVDDSGNVIANAVNSIGGYQIAGVAAATTVGGVSCPLNGSCSPPITCGGSASPCFLQQINPTTNFSTTVTASVTSSQLTLPVATCTGLTFAPGSILAVSQNSAIEWVVASSCSSSTVTLTTRGYYGSTATTYTSGAMVEQITRASATSSTTNPYYYELSNGAIGYGAANNNVANSVYSAIPFTAVGNFTAAGVVSFTGGSGTTVYTQQANLFNVGASNASATCQTDGLGYRQNSATTAWWAGVSGSGCTTGTNLVGPNLFVWVAGPSAGTVPTTGSAPSMTLSAAGVVNVPTGGAYEINGVPITGGGTPGGANTDVQYNSSSSFGGNSSWTTDGTGDTTQSGVATATAFATPTSSSAGYLQLIGGTAPTAVSNSIQLASPASVPTAYTLVMPAAEPTTSQVMAFTLSGSVATGAWVTPASAFTSISSGTNTTAAMVVGTGATLNWTGSSASGLFGPTITNTSTAGTNAQAGIYLSNSTSTAQNIKTGAAYIPYETINPNDLAFYNPTGNTDILNDGSGSNINFSIASATPQFKITSTAATLTVPLIGVSAGAETVTFSATPTFSLSTRMSTITLTANITSFTLGAGTDGQSKILCFVQGSGPYTVTAPSNVHGFFTIGTTNGKANCQSFNYNLAAAFWWADTTGVINE